jgi:hypothetical protein
LIKKHLWNKIAITFSAIFFIWCIWQHEIMMFPYMTERWNSTFQFFTGIVVPWGAAYDFTLLGEFLAYVLLAVALWFWEEP